MLKYLRVLLVVLLGLSLGTEEHRFTLPLPLVDEVGYSAAHHSEDAPVHQQDHPRVGRTSPIQSLDFFIIFIIIFIIFIEL